MSPTFRYESDSQPFWSNHPHCLHCNYDADEFPFAAHLGPMASKKRHTPWYRTRDFVAWLCEDCATYRDRVQWFVETVIDRYPNATLVESPGTQAEKDLPSTWKKFMAQRRQQEQQRWHSSRNQ